jgi:hypothetical protein
MDESHAQRNSQKAGIFYAVRWRTLIAMPADSLFIHRDLPILRNGLKNKRGTILVRIAMGKYE